MAVVFRPRSRTDRQTRQTCPSLELVQKDHEKESLPKVVSPCLLFIPKLDFLHQLTYFLNMNKVRVCSSWMTMLTEYFSSQTENEHHAAIIVATIITLDYHKCDITTIWHSFSTSFLHNFSLLLGHYLVLKSNVD